MIDTLPQLLRHAATQYGDREWVVLGDRRIRFADAERESSRLARGLLAAGVGKGTRIGLLMPNSPDWLLAWLAAGRIGAIVVTLSTMARSRELSWALKHADIDTLLIADRFMNHDYIERLERAIPELAEQQTSRLFFRSHPYLRRIFVWGRGDRPWAQPGPEALHDLADSHPQLDSAYLAEVESEVTPADLLGVIFTSGSVSEPKAVVHTHGASVRHALALQPFYERERADRIYSLMPFFWIGGLHQVFLSLISGFCVVCCDSTRPERVLGAAEREGVERLLAWPVQIEGLLAIAKPRQLQLPFLEAFISAALDESGQPIPRQRLPNTLGMTESFGVHSWERELAPLSDDHVGSFGQGLAGIERKIREGELLLRGYSLMDRYYKKEREETFDRDGFFHTGDMCRLEEDGRLYFSGRRGEMIKTGGANVAPREVEVVLESFDEIAEAVVVGLPDEVRGEVVAAAVVPAQGVELDVDALQRQLKREISTFKVPRHFVITSAEEIPRTESGKVQKPALREIVSAKLC